MGKYTCKICGKEFERVGNGVYCSGPHFRPCPICGKPVQFQRPSDPIKCCSPECTLKLTQNTRKSRPKKVCEECGKEFQPVNGTQRYCPGPHTSICTICGKEFTYTCSPKDKPATCSRECQEKLRSQTAQRKYGVTNVSQLDSVRKKISEVKSSDEAKARVAASVQKKYGVDNVSQIPAVRAKLSEVMKTEEYLKGREQTCLNKYGSKCPMQTEAIKKKRIETNYRKYGTPYPTPNKQYFQNRLLDGTKAENFISFRKDPKTFIQTHFDHAPHIHELCAELGCTDTPIYNTLIKFDCSDLLSSSISSMEQDITTWIEYLVPGIVVEHNNRTIISPKELDLYLPKYKIGIECNPTTTHNSSSEDPWGGPPKISTYHQEKSLSALSKGVFLFHVFGYEWVNRKHVIQSMIANLIGSNTSKIGARETHVCEVSSAECAKFLEDNHLQGNTLSSIRLGLRHNKTDELLAIMTFGKIRPTIGSTKVEHEGTWELSRFCNKAFTSVSGGASKLFLHFVKTFHPSQVVSFSDIAHTQGKLYQTLGFVSGPPSAPSYVWVTVDDKIYYNRVNCQKRNLSKLLNDPNIDIGKHTESEIMESHRFLRVYNSGTIRWTWTPTEKSP